MTRIKLEDIMFSEIGPSQKTMDYMLPFIGKSKIG